MDKDKYREKVSKKYGTHFLYKLGRASDRDVAAEFGIRDHFIVRRAREKFGIKPFSKNHPDLSGCKRPRVVVVFESVEHLMNVSDLEAAQMFHTALDQLRKRKGA